MNDVERFLDQACRRVSGPAALRQHLRKELEEHLEEAIEALVATGVSRDEATSQAIEGLGEPEVIREGLQSVYGQSLMSLFVDRAMHWKERTMKSEWKWSFAVQVGLVLLIAVEVLLVASTLTYIVPKVLHAYSDRGASVPEYLRMVVSVSGHVSGFWPLWALVLAGGLALFEWKCRSENKALIRTFVGVGTSLACIVVAFWVVGVTMVCSSLLL